MHADRVLWRLNGKPGAALGAACINNRAATCRLHTNSKTVGFFTTSNGRLIGAFHNRTRLKLKLGACLFTRLSVYLLCGENATRQKDFLVHKYTSLNKPMDIRAPANVASKSKKLCAELSIILFFQVFSQPLRYF